MKIGTIINSVIEIVKSLKITDILTLLSIIITVIGIYYTIKSIKNAESNIKNKLDIIYVKNSNINNINIEIPYANIKEDDIKDGGIVKVHE